jgi:hypothetical protein
MKHFTTLIHSSKFKYFCLIIFSIFGILLLQGQDTNKNNGDNNPITDKWWLNSDAFQPHHFMSQPTTVVTTSDGYDNFNMGNDAAECSITNNPNNPVVFWTGFNENPGTTVYGHHTENGYDPFTLTSVPFPNSAGDPWAATDSLGNLFYINLNGSVSGTWVGKSTDNGVTWSVVSGCTGFDRENISSDQTNGPFANYIYCGETGSGGAPFYRSTDHGASFQFMTSLSPHQLPGFMICVGPNGAIQGGNVYAVTYTYTGAFFPQTYNFHRSTDGGATWMTSISTITGIGFSGIDGGSGRGSINGIRCRAYPMIAADNSYGPYRGRLYCVWGNNPGGISGLHSDIWLKYSTDFGSSWSSLIQVNDDTNTTTSDQWFPAVWCDKLDNGKLYIKWYSTQDNPSSFIVNVMATYSTNGGVSFVAAKKITNQTWPYPNTGPCPGCVGNYRGDYDAIVGNGKCSMLSWFDGRNGTMGSFSAYFPDFAMRVNPATVYINNQNDSQFVFISVPSVKTYTDRAKFTSSITPNPTTGTITLTFVNKTTSVPLDSLTSYPDSLRLRIKTSGGVTPNSYTITVQGAGSNGTPVHKRTISLNINPVGISHNNNQMPQEYSLYQNYPNPFNPSTNIRFDIPKSGLVKLTVYDITGKIVSTLTNENYEAGKYSVNFNADIYSSGIYFYKIESNRFKDVRKMVLVK